MEVVVVGAGLVGTSLAYELSQLGAEVILVDRHDPGRATDAGAGICSPETTLGRDGAWMDLAFAARDHYERLARSFPPSDTGGEAFAPVDLLSVVRDPHEEPWLKDLVVNAEIRRPGALVEIRAEEAQRRFPPLSRPRRTFLNRNARRIDGTAVTAALSSVAAQHGLESVTASVNDLRRRGRRIVAVETSEGSLPCDAVAIAGGAWSAAFETILEVALPVRPLKGQIVHLLLGSMAASSHDWPMVQPLFGFYLVPWPGGRVACGATMESAGFDVRVTAAGVHDLLREALKTAPGLAEATLLETRVGLRPLAEDDRPIIGRLDGWDNVFVDTGHGTDGLLLGPYSGHLLAAEMAGPPQEALATFRPGRFGR